MTEDQHKGRLDVEVDAIIQHGEDRGLEPSELMTVCAAVVGRAIAAHMIHGLPPEDGMAMARQMQWAMTEAAGLHQGDGPTEH